MQHKQILQVLYMIFSCSKQNFSNNAPIFSWWGELLDTCLDNKQLKHTEECTAERGESHWEQYCSSNFRRLPIRPCLNEFQKDYCAKIKLIALD